jgi:hypothetical protein
MLTNLPTRSSVHAQREILQVEVQILDAAAGLAGVVVAQILRVEPASR